MPSDRRRSLPLHDACLQSRDGSSSSKQESIAKLIAEGWNVKMKDVGGSAPLHYLCNSRVVSIPCIASLITAKANVNSRDKLSRTALHYACCNTRLGVDVAQELLRCRADVNSKDKDGTTALHLLCGNDSFPPARHLLEARAQVNALNKAKWTPLHELCLTLGRMPHQASSSCMQELLEARADVMFRDFDGLEMMCDSFYDNHRVVNCGRLCDPSLECAMYPLWLAQASQLRNASSSEKFRWFHEVLLLLLDYDNDDLDGQEVLVVRRGNILQSVCEQREALTPLTHEGAVTFAGETGEGDGVLRELFVVVAQEFADENYNLFVCTNTDSPRLALSTRPCFNEDRDGYMEIVGRIMGLALVHEQHLPVRFAMPLIKQLLGIDLCMDDLLELDPELHNSILQLRSFTAEQLADMELDFTVDECHFGKRRKVDLAIDGTELPVTKGNVEVYIRLRMEHHLRHNVQMLASLERGLHHFCPKKLLLAAAKCFTLAEFDLLLSGTQDINVDNWQAYTKYKGCSARNNVIQWFWAAVKSFTKEERKLLLRFATGQTSAPVGGFQKLKSGGQMVPFTIMLKTAPDPTDALSHFPNAATCINQLTLPRYKGPDLLKKFLLLTVHEDMMTFAEQELED